MQAKLRPLWQKIKKHRVAVGVIAVVLTLAVVNFLGYWFKWDWAGLSNGFSKITTTTNNGNGTTIATEQPLTKTLWDWMQLLIIPFVLAVGGYLFNLTISRNEQKSTQLRDQTEREIASDNQREAALKEYIDKISELLLQENLRASKPEDEVQTIARVKTLTVLTRLDSSRKRTVLQFLHESRLILKDKCVIDLRGADLREADLFRANLAKANLRGVNL